MKKISTCFLFATVLSLIFSCNSSPDKTQTEVQIVTFDEVSETAAIMKVIDGETDCFFKGNCDCWTKFWSHENYAFQGWNNSDGAADAPVGWEKINSQGKGSIEIFEKRHPLGEKNAY